MLPPLNSAEDLPAGIHPADWKEIEDRFGRDSAQRTRAFSRLRHLHELAARTGSLARFLVFGSFVSGTPEARFGASIFWIREGMLSAEMMQDFLETWQTKRDGTKRGIVEVKP